MPSLVSCLACFRPPRAPPPVLPDATAVLSVPTATTDQRGKAQGVDEKTQNANLKQAATTHNACGVQAAVLQAFQAKLCEAKLGCLPARLVGFVKESLGASVVRLYGLDSSPDAGDAGRLVLLASCCDCRCGGGGESAAGPACDSGGGGSLDSSVLVPGWSLDAVADAEPTLGPGTGASQECGPAALLLLQSAVAAQAPVSYSLNDASVLTSEQSASAANPADIDLDVETHGSRLFAAVPLRVGGATIAVLWISDTGTAGADGVTAAEAVLGSAAALQQIGLLASLALAAAAAAAAGAGGAADSWLSWLSATLRHVAGSRCLGGLVRGLCDTLATHVRQQFLLDPVVQAALVPLDDLTRTAFMLHPEAPPPPPQQQAPLLLRPGSSAAISISGSSARFRLGACGQDCPVAAVEGSFAPGSSTGNPPARRKTLGPTQHGATTAEVGGAGGGEGAHLRPHAAGRMPLGSFRSIACERLPPQHIAQHQPGQTAQHQKERKQDGAAQPLNRARRSASYDNLHGMISPRHQPLPQQTPTTRLLAASSAVHSGSRPSTRVVPLTAAMAAAGGRLAAAVEPEAAGMPSGGHASYSHLQLQLQPLPALRAKAFQLSSTLLRRMLVEAVEAAPTGDAPGRGGGGGPAAVISGPTVADCARWVQDVRQPSRDVYILMASGAAIAAAAAGAIGNAAPAAAGAASGTAAAAGPGGAVQSLTLLGLRGGPGSLLGLYLTFPSRLPGRLLEAINASCCGLLEQTGLAEALRARLSAELASELSTVLAGVPGDYAVLPSVGSGGGAAGEGVGGGTRFRRGQSQLLSASNSLNTNGDCCNGRGGSSSGGAGLLASASASAGGPGRMARTTGGFVLRDTGAAGDMHMGTAATDITSSEFLTSGAPDSSMGTRRGYTVPVAATQMGAITAIDLHTHVTGELNLRRTRPEGRPGGTALPMSAAAARHPPQQHYALRDNPRERSAPSLAAAAEGGGSGGPPAVPPLGSSLLTGGGGGSQHTVTNSQYQTAELFDPLEEAAAAGGGGPGFVTTILTVHEADGGSSLLTHMGVLVDAITNTLTTLQPTAATHNHLAPASATIATATAATTTGTAEEFRRSGVWCGSSAGSCRSGLVGLADDELSGLQLYDILGEGASGVVLRGIMGTSPVAVKLIELPEAELLESSALLDIKKIMVCDAMADGGAAGKQRQTQPAAAVAGAAAGTEPAAPPLDSASRLDLKRSVLRNAMELAVLKSVSHINIVQCHGVYDTVRLHKLRMEAAGRPWTCVLRRSCDSGDGPPALNEAPLCTAIVTELCTGGSLAGVLADRSFPRVQLCGPATSGGANKGALAAAAVAAQQQDLLLSRKSGSGQWVRIDMQGVYLTLLEIALALRHLHSRRLVHRDLKPANILLKTSPGDPRGWTCKLADFGFALVLDRHEQEAGAVEPAGQQGAGADQQSVASAAGGPRGGAAAGRGEAATAAVLASGHPVQSPHSLNSWHTIQDQACGTVTHMAPEAMKRNSRIDASVDVFSYGIIMWELVCGRGNRPYSKLQPEEIPRAVLAGMRPHFPEEIPSAYRRLAQACWSADPCSRPRASDLVAAIKLQLSQRLPQQ